MTTHTSAAAAVAGAAVLVSVLGGCGAATQPAPGTATSQVAAEANPPGDIPDNQAFVLYTAADHSYTVKYPEGWAQTSSGAEVTFSDKFNSMTLTDQNGFYQPTEEFARTVEVPGIATATKGYTAGTVSTVQRGGAPVVLITYTQDSPPSPVTGTSVRQDVQRYEYSHAGRGVVLTLASPVGADNVDPWRTITDSLRWQP